MVRAARRIAILLSARLWLCAIIVLLHAAPASAHQGPPFPIVVDRRVGDYVVSVWADPDIGEATFYTVVESPDGGPPDRPPEVSMWVQPVSGRLERKSYATTIRRLRGQVQFEVQPYFDQKDLWTVGIQLGGPGQAVEELTVDVTSTPPGYGPWDLAVYLFPFVLLSGLWTLAMIRRRRSR